MTAHALAPRTFALRYRGRQVALPPGEYLLGRDDDSPLAIDDDLASRRHARLIVTGTGVRLEDCGSANGVFVNEVRIHQPVLLEDGDRILIGATQILFMAGPGFEGTKAISDVFRAPRISSSPPRASRASFTSEAPRIDTRKADAFELFGTAADQLMAKGDAKAAARLLAGHVKGVVAGAKRNAPIGDELLDIAGHYCVKLSAALRDPSWADRAVEMHDITERPLSEDLARELNIVLRTVPGIDRRRLSAYQAKLQRKLTRATAADAARIRAVLTLG